MAGSIQSYHDGERKSYREEIPRIKLIHSIRKQDSHPQFGIPFLLFSRSSIRSEI